MDVTARLLHALSPVLESSGLELVDVVVGGSQVRVTVDRPGGIDLEALAEANREVSRVLDEMDPFPSAYTLEVSSPGLERRLRTPAHFARAVGEKVSVRTLADDRAGPSDPRRADRRRRRRLHPRGSRGARGLDAPCIRPDRAGANGVRVGAGASGEAGPPSQDTERTVEIMSKTNFEFLDALGQIARDKGISVDTLLDALANALVAAYKRRPDAAEEAVVTIDPESGEIRVYGQELDEEGNVVREWDDTPADFGRIAAQTAKQVILQRIREVERDMKYEEYAGREGDIVTGIVQQTDNRYTLLDLGKVEALLPQAEQVSYERYEHGARLKAYIVEVRKTTKGPQIVVSRTHPGLIKRLFELEVPEISGGVVELKAVARSRDIAPRSRSGRTTPMSTPSAPVSARAARGCAWSPTSCGASASTSCRSPTIPSNSSRTPSPRPEFVRSTSTTPPARRR